MSDKKFIVGLDIGYGNTKIAFGEVGMKPETLVYPSGVARIEENKNSELEGAFYTTINGQKWVAGVGAENLDNASNILNSNYIRTDEYKALFLSALDKINHSVVDTLVTGLPVNQFYTKGEKEYLEKSLSGEFVVSNGKKVTVKNVRVFPQPLGAFANYKAHCNQEDLEDLSDISILVVDIGFYSFDYCLITRGKLKQDFSGNTNCGVSQIVSLIHDEVLDQHDFELDTFYIASILRNQKTKIYIDDGRKEISPFLDMASKKVASQALEPLFNDLDRLKSTVKVLFTGGGAKYFIKGFSSDVESVASMKRKYQILPSNADTVLDNAVGFFYAGFSI